MATQIVRYEVRYIRTADTTSEPGMFDAGETIVCARRHEAIDRAKELAGDPHNCMVEAWQFGADGGDPAIATGLLWSRNLDDV